jgi:alanine-synthesizing transaminase|tara:strand:- start:1004 stop:2203 length:1200 start_codon:yes stop_codon:yes gene_type:complete
MDKEFPRVNKLPPYIFNEIQELKMEARRNGEDIIDFGMGNPDQPTPDLIVEKLRESSLNPSTHRYSQSKGIPRLRKAITDWYKRRFDVDLNPESEAVVTMGSKEGLAHLALATLDKGDAVLVPNPSYPVHPYGFVIAGADIRHVPIGEKIDFFVELEKAIKNSFPKPKMLIINFPSNPSTECVDLEFFKKIIKIAKENKIWVVQDLAYADICFDGYKAPSILQVEGAKEVAVEFFSLSKSYNMPGWRVGFCCGNKDLLAALARIKSYLDYGLFTPIQVAAIKALDEGDQLVEGIRDIYQSRRDVLVKGLNDAGWKVDPPKATMFVWAKIPDFLIEMGSLEFSKQLLADAKVAVSPGIGFGEYGEGYVRFSLIENEHRTRQAIRGIKQFLSKNRNIHAIG